MSMPAHRPGRVLAAAALLALAGCFPGALPPEGDAGLSLEVVPTPTQPVTGEPVTWTLEVSNDGGDPVSLFFPTTQHGDVTLSSQGVDVYVWSERRAFSTAVDRVVVLSGEAATFELEDAELTVAPGDYELLATLASSPFAGLARTTVTVDAP